MKKKKFFSFSFYFWIAFVLLMTSLFLINRAIIGKAITKIKDSPSFSHTEIINNTVKETLENSPLKEMPSLEDDKEKLSKTNDTKMEEELSTKDDIDSFHQNEPSTQNAEVEEPTKKKSQETAPLPNKNEMRDIDVYFASVNDNGVVTREKCVRRVERSLSPMVDSLKALLKGPTKEEAKRGIRSFIPADTHILSASIKEGTAIINLSEDFQFNRYGIEGYNIQLQQIVFTVCSFPTVKSVQFLIEGQKRDFIGSEGVWIGSPLTINSF